MEIIDSVSAKETGMSTEMRVVVSNQERDSVAPRRFSDLDDKRVAVTFTGLHGYSDRVPFDPPEKYPECPLPGTSADNQVYAWIRRTLFDLGFDRANFNTPDWNPLREIIEPGMTVLIKPNTVSHEHQEHKEKFSVIIHASILRAVLDYVCIALQGRGKIVVADSQVIFGLFDEAMAASKVDQLLNWYRKQTPVPIDCFDLRTVRGVRTWMYGKWGRKKVEADPRGYQWVDLGDQSLFRDIDPRRLRIAIASYKDMYKHHSAGRHEYLFPKSVLESDAIIGIPKMKTHRRTGISLALRTSWVFQPLRRPCHTSSPDRWKRAGTSTFTNPGERQLARGCMTRFKRAR